MSEFDKIRRAFVSTCGVLGIINSVLFIIEADYLLACYSFCLGVLILDRGISDG